MASEQILNAAGDGATGMFDPATQPSRIQATIYASGIWNNASVLIEVEPQSGVSFKFARLSQAGGNVDVVQNIDVIAHEINFTVQGGDDETAISLYVVVED